MDKLKVKRAFSMLNADKFTKEEEMVDELLSMAIAFAQPQNRVALVDELVEELVASLGVLITMKYVNLVDIVKNSTGLERAKVEERVSQQLMEAQEETLRLIMEKRGVDNGKG